MKKYFYFAGILLVVLIVASLIISQVILSSRIKKEIIDWCSVHTIKSSDFKCRVNLLTRTITLRNWVFKQSDNDFRIEKVSVSFGLFDLLSKKTIRLIRINNADITLKHFLPFFPVLATRNPDNNLNNNSLSPTNNFLIDELKIENLTLRIELPGGDKTQDISIEALLQNIGTNQNTTFSVKAIANSSSLEIVGDFNFDDWKKRLTYRVNGKNVSLGVLNVLEEGFFPSEVRDQLLSLYFKNVLQIKLTGKINIDGNGEIKEQAIDSKLKFLVSELICETENERIKSLIRKINSNDGDLEINYKIYGTLQNPYLTYDIAF